LQGAAREKTSSASHFEIFREHSEHAGMKPRNAGETEVGSHEETEHSQERNRNRKPRRKSRSRKSRRESARPYESELLVPFYFSINYFRIMPYCFPISLLLHHYFAINCDLSPISKYAEHPHQPASCMIIRVPLGSCRKYMEIQGFDPQKIQTT